MLLSVLVPVLLLLSRASATNHILRINLPDVQTQYPESKIRLRSHRFRQYRHEVTDKRCATDAVQAFIGMLDIPINSSSILPCTTYGCAGCTMEELFERYYQNPICARDSCSKYCTYPLARVRGTIVAYGNEEDNIEGWLRKYGPLAVAVDTSEWSDAATCTQIPEPDTIALVVGYTPESWTLQIPNGIYTLPRGKRACGIGSAVYVVSSKELF